MHGSRTRETAVSNPLVQAPPGAWRPCEEVNVSDSIIHVTDAEFDARVMKSEIPVLLDFWAPWCGPCLMIGPILEEVARNFQGRAVVAKINVDENPQTPQTYGVMAIPTLMVFKGGELKEKSVGVVSKEKIGELVTKYL
jgi:thioredoxin 1